jgi:hypothetical protein
MKACGLRAIGVKSKLHFIFVEFEKIARKIEFRRRVDIEKCGGICWHAPKFCRDISRARSNRDWLMSRGWLGREKNSIVPPGLGGVGVGHRQEFDWSHRLWRNAWRVCSPLGASQNRPYNLDSARAL